MRLPGRECEEAVHEFYAAEERHIQELVAGEDFDHPVDHLGDKTRGPNLDCFPSDWPWRWLDSIGHSNSRTNPRLRAQTRWHRARNCNYGQLDVGAVHWLHTQLVRDGAATHQIAVDS